MYFLTSKSGTRYPVSRILSIGPDRDGGSNSDRIVTVELTDGETVETYRHEIEALMRRPVRSFPAAPETYIVRYDGDEELPYWKTLIIGWSIGADGGVYPVTADGVNDQLEEISDILTPDGHVTRPYSTQWNSVAEWLKEQDEGR